MEFKNKNLAFVQKTKNKFSNMMLHEWLCFVGLFVFGVTMAFTMYNFVNYIKQDKVEKIWFGIFDRFTYQSNWILFVFCVFYFFFPKHQIFKGDKLLVSTMVYIFFTFIGYNVVLVGISGDRGYTGSSVAIASNAWLHIIAPLYFIMFGYFYMYDKAFKFKEYKYHLFLLKGMIYPTIYGIYLCSIPFVYTNWVNPKTGLMQSYTIYGSATNTAENPISWAYISVMFFVFFPSTYAMFFYSWKGITILKQKRMQTQ